MSGVAADLIVLLHFAFIVFVVLGGLLALRWKRAALFHLPCALWGALIEFRGWICPLTPLERYFRQTTGEPGYTGSFIDHYVMPLVYPEGLTRAVQIVLALVVLAFNGIVYLWVFSKWRGRDVKES